MRNFNEQLVPTNFIYPEIKPEHFKFGDAQIVARVLRPSGDWRDFLPPEELQTVRGIESSACYIEAQEHAIATLLEERYSVKDQNYSARFNALLSDGTEGGGDPIKGADSIRHDGLIQDYLMNFADVNSWDEFHSWKGVDETACRKVGQDFRAQWDISHDIVFTREEPVAKKYEKIKQALSYAPLCVSVLGWYEKDGVYIKPEGMTDNHLVELVHVDENNQATIRDTYVPYEKKLAPFYSFDFGMRHSIVKKTAITLTENEVEWTSFWDRLIGWITTCFSKFFVRR